MTVRLPILRIRSWRRSNMRRHVKHIGALCGSGVVLCAPSPHPRRAGSLFELWPHSMHLGPRSPSPSIQIQAVCTKTQKGQADVGRIRLDIGPVRLELDEIRLERPNSWPNSAVVHIEVLRLRLGRAKAAQGGFVGWPTPFDICSTQAGRNPCENDINDPRTIVNHAALGQGDARRPCATTSDKRWGSPF